MEVFWRTFLANFLAVMAGCFVLIAVQKNHQQSPVDQFDLTSEKIAKDLEGRQVSISHGQVWPFDSGQSLAVSVIAKKQLDNYVIVVADIRATAGVEQQKDQKEKTKLPSKVSVSGHFRLTYEKTGNEWYLIGVDSLTARATAQFN